MDRQAISPIFAYLPNGIIREIVAYTGATYKKRNGKYMGQIPRTDPRYALLSAIPQKTFWFLDRPPHCVFFASNVILSRITDTCPIHVSLEVIGSKYTDDPYCGNTESICYKLQTISSDDDIRLSKFYHYYRETDPVDAIIAENRAIIAENRAIIAENRDIIAENRKTRKLRGLLQHAFISISMFVTGVIYATSVTKEIASIRSPHLASIRSPHLASIRSPHLA